MKYWPLRQIFLKDDNCLEIKNDTAFDVGDAEMFQVVRQLGEGASCLTYYAQNASGNSVVVKEFCPAEFRRYAVREEDGSLRMEFPKGVFADYLKERYTEQRLAFHNEWLMQRKLQRENVITGTNNPELFIGGPDAVPYIVMNCDGQAMGFDDLREFQVQCAEKNADYVTIILRVLRAYATEISRLHRQGMLLMDIKPGNLLITSWNQELLYRRIIDYGSVRSLEEIRGNSEIRLSYTAEFAAPEIKEKDFDQIGYASDVFSFGLTVIQFLIGRVVEANDLYLLYLSDEHLRKNLIRMAEESGFTAIAGKDEQFFHLLNQFISWTLSEEICEDGYEFRAEYLGAIPASRCRKRLSRMEDVIDILSLLIGDSEYQHGEFNLSGVLQRVHMQADRFREAYYGPEAEKEFGKVLFSQALLPEFVSAAEKTTQPVDIFALMESKEHSYIEAESGLGKTSAFKYAYANCLKKKQKMEILPVWIPMGQLIEPTKNDEESLFLTYICGQLFGNTADGYRRKKHIDQLEQWMNEPNLPFRLVLFVDGMNEACWQKQYAGIKKELLRLMERNNVLVILSGQNQKREFAEYGGRVWKIEPLRESAVRDYLDEKLPIWKKETQVREKIEAMFATLTTPSLLHYFCIPFLGLSSIPAASIPDNEAQIMEQYLCGMDYCIQNKIHAHVSEYPGQTRPGFGAYLLNRVAGNVCWQMAYHGELYAAAELLKHTTENCMEKSEEDTLMIDGVPVRETVYREKIQSLSWCSYLFEYHDSRFYIIHESYRNYLAAKYLVGKLAKEPDILPEFWSEIPPCVMKYVSQMVTREQILRLRKRLLKKHGTYVGRKLKEEIINEEMVSEFFERDDEMAGENLCRLIQMSPEFSSMEKKLLQIRIPKDFFLEEKKAGQDELKFAQISEQWEMVCHSTAHWLQEHGLPGAYAEQIVLVLIGSSIVYPEWEQNDKRKKISEILQIPGEALWSPLGELDAVLEHGLEKDNSSQLLLQIAARLVLLEMEECNQRGVVYERLDRLFDEEMLKQISFVAGHTFFTRDFYFQPELVLKKMLDRKRELYAGVSESDFFEWNTERYFAQEDGLKERDVAAMRRQEGTMTLLKQFVLLEHETYHKQGAVISSDRMVAFAQLYLMLHHAVCHCNLGEMDRMVLEKRVTYADCSKCLDRADLRQACLLLGCFGGITVKDFCKTMWERICHYKILYPERLKKKYRLEGLLLIVCGIIGCIRSPLLILKLLPILAMCAVFGVSMKILIKDGAVIAEFIVQKIAELWRNGEKNQ